MKFLETKLRGAFIIEPEPMQDERGFFARVFCKSEFETHGLKTNIVQCGVSFNRKKGTIRGMHYQIKPFEEAKLIRSTQGVIYDVIVDLRPDSETYKQWFSIELASTNHKMLYVPEGMAHGFQTLEDNTEVFYQMSEFHRPEHARGIRWNDPSFSIPWPMAVTVMSQKDRSYPDFRM